MASTTFQQLVLIGHPSAPEKLPVFFAGTTLGASSPDHRSPSPGGQTTWREIPVSEPHLIVVDSTGRDTRNPADNRAVAIETDLRCGRRRLSPCRRAALLLSACLAEDQFEKALREFAPFLGPEGIIAVAHARTPSEQLDVNRLLLALDRWLQNTGLEFGFRRWEMPRELKHHGQNWTVISRDPVLYQGPAYWSLRPEDLPILEFAKSAAAPAALA